MKKFLGIIMFAFLSFSIVFAASSWFEIKLDNNTSRHWNLNKAEEISPYKFKIPSVMLKSQDRMNYEAFLIEQLVPYCGKPNGRYKEPENLLIKGKPTTSKRAIQFLEGVEEKLWEDYKQGKSKKKPGLTLEEFQFEWFGNYIRKSDRSISYEIPYNKFSGTMFIFCSTNFDRSLADDYTQSNEKKVVAANINFSTDETVVIEYFDCRNRKLGIDLSGEPFWPPQPVKKNTYGEMFLDKVCAELD
jgi:hypothetical protein